MGTPIVKILVASHKEYRMPDDSIYLPLHVGAEGKVDADGQPLDLGWTKDNTGDNISRLNPGFCELTGLYWAWKNLKADYIGLVHYRRHFCLKKKSRDPFENIITGAELRPILGQYWVFVPKKRRYFIETLYSHYAHTHYAEHLDATREVIAERCPEYLPSFDRIMRRRYGYMFNMMIMRRDLADKYCKWLFDILLPCLKRWRHRPVLLSGAVFRQSQRDHPECGWTVRYPFPTSRRTGSVSFQQCIQKRLSGIKRQLLS